MQYPGGSASESSGMSGGVSNHRNGSAGSSPDFPSGGYDSAEYGDSPPDSTNRGSTGGHVQHPYSHTPPALEASYAGAPMGSGMPYHSPASYGSSANVGYSTSRQGVNYSVGGSGGYVYTGNGNDYPSPTARSHPSGLQQVQPTWRSSDFGFASPSSRPRHSDSPPLSPIDTTTRSTSYFPGTREYALNAAGSGAVPSSPTTPSSVSDSPSTPFSPHYASSPYGGSTHGHSHSHSSSSASGYIQGTPLPSLNTGHAGGHFVPPTGNDYPIPVSPSPYSPSHHGYGRSSPPDHARMPSGPPPTTQPPSVGPLAGPGFASRPFLCDDCGMNFARTHDLKRHQTTHVPGVKKTHPCPYCGKNLSRRDAIKRHVVSKQCPVANDKGYGWPPPEGHVPPPPDTHIERASRARGENPYPVLAVSPSERSSSYSSGYGNGSPSSPGPYSPNGYSSGPGFNGVASPGGYGDHGSSGPPPTSVVFEYDHRSSAYRGR